MVLMLAFFPEWQPEAWKEPICLPAWALNQMLVPGMFHIYFPNLQQKRKKNGLLTPLPQQWELGRPRMSILLLNAVFSCSNNDQLHFLSQEPGAECD